MLGSLNGLFDNLLDQCRRRRLLLRNDSKMPADLLGDFFVHRAGVSLLLGDAELREQRQDHTVRLLAFARQLVNANLLHTVNAPQTCGFHP